MSMPNYVRMVSQRKPLPSYSPSLSLKEATMRNSNVIAEVLKESEIGLKGVEETRFILDTLKTSGLNNEIQLDLTLARGLNYYTGAIFEVKALDVQIGSITGGGRYDNLTGNLRYARALWCWNQLRCRPYL